MAGMHLTLTGTDRLKAVLRQRLPDQAAKGLAAGLNLEAELIKTVSQRDFVPVDFGTLRSSAFVNPPARSGNIITSIIGYGGAASAYALAIHEHPSNHSPPSWRNGVHFNVGGPKYLEAPLNAAAAGMADRIARRMELGP